MFGTDCISASLPMLESTKLVAGGETLKAAIIAAAAAAAAARQKKYFGACSWFLTYG
jgi:hypothetical protein